MYDVGDTATLTLTVDPHDVTTEVGATVTAPDGTTTEPVPTDAGDGQWSLRIKGTQAGTWTVTWNVTGTGEGRESDHVLFAPTQPAQVPARWAFATTGDLATWLQAAPPDDAPRMLRRAAELVADACTSGYYVDTDERPTDEPVRVALRDATCAQVEQWINVGEDNDIDGYPRALAVSGVGLSTNALPDVLAPRARRVLRNAGLVGGGYLV